MYTIETLKKINPQYNLLHGVTQSDVDKANRYLAAIERSKVTDRIQVGDIVELTTSHGDYYQNAHIETYSEETDRWSVCKRPYTPFVYFNHYEKLCCETSGGAWCGVPNSLKHIGKQKKAFTDFGHNGACAQGAFCIEAEVNVWEYKQENPLYGNYSTKDWDKFYVSYRVDEFGKPVDGSPYRWFATSGGIAQTAFATQEDYDTWLKTLRAVSFKGNWPNQTVVFGYKQKRHLISKEAWEQLDLPKDTRLLNGVNLVKVKYDDTLHQIDVYAFSNSGTLDFKKYKAYELARGRNLISEGY